MNELGVVVDVSHLNEPGFWDVVQAAQAPFMATHSCCRALCDHPRNLRDEQLRALAEKGGIVAITFVPDFIDAHNPTFDGLLDHIEHAVAVAGIDHVGLGSDFDGGGLIVEDATCLPTCGGIGQTRLCRRRYPQKFSARTNCDSCNRSSAEAVERAELLPQVVDEVIGA